MRALGLILLFALTPAFATSIVYKAEQSDGVTILTDRPIKDAEHQEIIHLQAENSLVSSGTSLPKMQPLTAAAGASDKKAIEGKLAMARLDLQKAQNRLVQARLQQMKTKHECEVQEYRSHPSQTNLAACQTIAANNEELDLARAHTSITQLQSQLDNIG